MAASRDSKKGLSIRHEQDIANLFNGKRSKSSGASDVDKADVRAFGLMFECKMTTLQKPKYVTQFEKVAKEAYEEGKTPALALRFYDPDSPLSDKNGWIDLIMMLAGDSSEYIKSYFA